MLAWLRRSHPGFLDGEMITAKSPSRNDVEKCQYQTVNEN